MTLSNSVLLDAWERRKEFHRKDEITSAYRLLDGREEGAPGWTLDRYGSCVLSQRFGPVEPSSQDQTLLVDFLRTRMGPEVSVYLKHRGRTGQPGQVWPVVGRCIAGPGAAEAGSVAAPFTDPLAGRPGRLVVWEEGMRLGVDLSYGQNTGLFLDARAMRRWVRNNSAGRRILNLFSYTSAFGVAAAVGGCRSVTNVDAVPSALERGRANFVLNGLPQDSRTHLRSDVGDFLRRAKKRGERWDGVVLDPPPVATQRPGRSKKGRGKGFVPGEALGRLIARSLEVLEPEAWLVVLSAARSSLGLDACVPKGEWPEIQRDADFPSLGSGAPGLLSRILRAPVPGERPSC